MANQEKDLRNSKPLSKLILVKPLLRNPGWKSMFLLMLNRGSIYFNVNTVAKITLESVGITYVVFFIGKRPLESVAKCSRDNACRLF